MERELRSDDGFFVFLAVLTLTVVSLAGLCTETGHRTWAAVFIGISIYLVPTLLWVWRKQA